MIYGRNNSGKSSLIRLLSLISESLGVHASGPLELRCQAVRDSTFDDLRWKGTSIDDEQEIRIAFEWPGTGVTRVEFALYWFTDWNRLLVRNLLVWTDSSDEPHVVFDWVPRPQDETRLALAYEVAGGGAPQSLALTFTGLIPSLPDQTSPPSPATAIVEQVAKRLRPLGGAVQWLMASRRVPQRIVKRPGAPRWRMSPDGSDACTVLAFHRNIRSEVSGWYRQHLDRVLEIVDVPPSGFRTVLRNLKRADFDIDLVDTGEGMVQALPVLVAVALTRHYADGGPGLLAIEEPESHLHPDLQRALAGFLCASIQASPDMRVVMETHSEHLLLAVQLEIVRGNLKPDDVIVYWARQLDDGQSIAEPVTFDTNARPLDNWPRDAFSENQVLARELLTLRREKRRV